MSKGDTMKRKITAGLFIVFMSAWVVYAGDILWGSITNYTSTKANKTVPISPVEPIKAMTTSSVCTAYLNDTTGTGMLMTANAWYEIRVPGNISNIIFACTTTAAPGSTVTVIK
jgi:hypothetical protein